MDSINSNLPRFCEGFHLMPGIAINQITPLTRVTQSLSCVALGVFQLPVAGQAVVIAGSVALASLLIYRVATSFPVKLISQCIIEKIEKYLGKPLNEENVAQAKQCLITYCEKEEIGYVRKGAFYNNYLKYVKECLDFALFVKNNNIDVKNGDLRNILSFDIMNNLLKGKDPFHGSCHDLRNLNNYASLEHYMTIIRKEMKLVYDSPSV